MSKHVAKQLLASILLVLYYNKYQFCNSCFILNSFQLIFWMNSMLQAPFKLSTRASSLQCVCRVSFKPKAEKTTRSTATLVLQNFLTLCFVWVHKNTPPVCRNRGSRTSLIISNITIKIKNKLLFPYLSFFNRTIIFK